MEKLVLAIVISALIGWITNYIAIKMLFRPYKEINLIFFKIQGLIPKRKNEIGEGIAETIDKELVSIKDIVNQLSDDEFFEKLELIIDDVMDKNLKSKIKESFPVIQIFLTDKVLNDIKNTIKNIIFENKEQVISFFLSYIEEKANFKEIIISKISDFSLEKMEKLVFDLASKELKHIEIVGAVLGAIIGFLQYLIFIFM
ncbi:MAG: DUF445 family protein [Fusobacterium gastrosuis]|uniref:DUF445 domain-containing protein n=1 Tax=Fusobacterium gastrosuis TaxID=1755100 RepID=UPI002A8536C3|nr:DUF445 family protein [Fusobacterium gastrosuis]